ncbi:MAG: GyrI-like domain-containing protein, partial [Planctomycetes bacterium]|nr:GyrI-like domain-containing protein [Planctomycetota bacterium]
MEAQIVDISGFSVVGQKRRIGCGAAHAECPKLWQDFLPRLLEIVPEGTPCFGVCSNFEAPEEAFPQGSFQYLVGVKAENAKTDEGLDAVDIVSGRFARFAYTGPISDIG